MALNFGLLDTSLPERIGAMPANALAMRRQRLLQDEQIAGQREQQQMQNALSRMQMEKGQREMNADEALRTAAAGGGEWSDVIERVRGVDPIRALDLESKVGAVQSSRAAAKSAVTKQAWDKLERYRQAGLQNVRTPQQYASWLQQQHTDPELAPVMSMLPPLEESLRTIPSDPKEFEQFRQQGMLGMEKWLEMNKPTSRTLNLGGSERVQMVNPYTGEVVSEQTYGKTMSPGEIAADARSRASLAQGERQFRERMDYDRSIGVVGKPPAGYRKTDDGNLEPIPGGPADKAAVASEGERKAATLLARMEGSLRQMRNVTNANSAAAKPELLPAAARAVTFGQLEAPVNALTSSDRQRVEAAQLDILDAALTLGTGAAYTREQLEGYRKSYFPQLGDKDEAVADKKVRLDNVLQAARIAAGRAAPAGQSPSKAYIETRRTPDGRVLGKREDGSVEVIQ